VFTRADLTVAGIGQAADAAIFPSWGISVIVRSCP
jgi:hypothetical protein